MDNKKTIINKICEKWRLLCPPDIVTPISFLADFKKFLIMKKISKANLAYICRLHVPKFIKYIIKAASTSPIMDRNEYKFIFKKYEQAITNYEKKRKDEKISDIVRTEKIPNVELNISRISKFKDLIDIRHTLKIYPIKENIEDKIYPIKENIEDKIYPIKEKIYPIKEKISEKSPIKEKISVFFSNALHSIPVQVCHKTSIHLRLF